MVTQMFLLRCSSYPRCIQSFSASRVWLLESHLNNEYSHNRHLSSLPSDDELHIKNINEKYESEKAARQARTKKLRQWSFYGVVVFAFSGACLLVSEYGAPDVDDDGVRVSDRFTGVTGEYLKRAYAKLRQTKEQLEEPMREYLLPDPLKKPYIQPRYTVLLELRDLLVHPEWNFGSGWRFKKRPGVDFLIETCKPPQFELVIFTVEQPLNVSTIIDSLDKNGVVMYRLFRDSTRLVGNTPVKDISTINRDLSKVIIVDTDRDRIQYQPHNAIVLPPWDGNLEDRSLYDLAAMLKTIDATNCQDVRTVLSTYSREDDPLEAFRQRQILLMETQKQEIQQPKSSSSNAAKSWTKQLTRK